MFEKQTVAVVIPAFNERALISHAISGVPTYVDFIIVVDDASSDGTQAVLDGFSTTEKVHCIFHTKNQGVGGAIVRGYKKALALGADLVAVMAGDAQMDPADLPKLLTPIASGHADYAKGDRLSWPGVASMMPLARFIGNHVLSVMTRYTSGYADIRDSQCGYTAIRRETLSQLDLDELWARYGFPNDLLAQLHTIGAKVAQVPVRPIYGDEVSGISWYTALVRVPRVLVQSRKRRQTKEHLREDNRELISAPTPAKR